MQFEDYVKLFNEVLLLHSAIPGGVTVLNEQGHLTLSYLGTDPAMMVMPSTQSRETKYDEFASEIRKYQQIIREKSGSQGEGGAFAATVDCNRVVVFPKCYGK